MHLKLGYTITGSRWLVKGLNASQIKLIPTHIQQGCEEKRQSFFLICLLFCMWESFWSFMYYLRWYSPATGRSYGASCTCVLPLALILKHQLQDFNRNLLDWKYLLPTSCFGIGEQDFNAPWSSPSAMVLLPYLHLGCDNPSTVLILFNLIGSAQRKNGHANACR